MDNPNTSYQLGVQSILSSTNKKNGMKTYEFIEVDRKETIHMSMVDAAKAYRVSGAAIVRYAQELGYEGHRAIKISIAQDVIEPGQQIYGQLSKGDAIPAIVNKIFDSNIRSLRNTSDVFSKESIGEAVNLVLGYRCLLFFGMGGSGCVAMDEQHKFLKTSYIAMALTDGNLQAMTTSVLTSRDVPVAVSHSGASKGVLIAMDITRQSGAKTIAITSYGKSPIVERADVVLYTSSNETAFNSDTLSSRVAELTVIDMLYIGVSYKRYDEPYTNMLKARKALDSTKI